MVFLSCCNKNFDCSYTIWHNVRNMLIEATFEYIQIHFGISDYEEGTFEYNSMCSLKQYIEEIEYNGNKLLFNLNKYSSEFPEFNNLLIQFGVGGLCALCNKSDNQAFYSVGNSYDICQLIKIVKPFLLKDRKNLDAQENWLYNCINNISIIFEESVEKKEFVRIC